MPGINWGSVQGALAARFADRVAVRDATGTLTYTALFAWAGDLGRELVTAGAGVGDMVGTLFRNAGAAVAGSYAVQLSGAAEVPLNIAYTPGELVATARLAGCRRVLCTAEHAGIFAAADIEVHLVGAPSAGPFDASLFPTVPPDAPRRLAFTSGTTGTPKAIVYSQQARFIANILLQASLPFLPAAGERIVLMTPFAHGASIQAYAWLDQGGEVVLLDGVDLPRLEALLDEGVAALFAPPTVLAKITAAFAGRHFQVRTIFTGTAPLAPATYAAARAMFGPVVRLTYGKSEVTNPITVLPPAETDRYYAEGGSEDGSACVGWPAVGVELAIEDGEVLIRAQHMSAGTIDATGLHPWRADGFHPTGDIGRIDDRGRLHLVARVADAMKSGGYKIYPQEIERALAEAGIEAVVVGFPSTYWGEIIVAVADRPRPGWETACATLASFKRPRAFFVLDPLPRNAQGKLVRRLIIGALQSRYRLVDGARPRFEEGKEALLF